MTSFKVEKLRLHYKAELIALALKHEQLEANLANSFHLSAYVPQLLDEELDRYGDEIDEARRQYTKELNSLLGSVDEKSVDELIRGWEDDFLVGSNQLPKSFLAPY
jgi:recombinational DNA repair ATPase RecF